ncbi:hypothetical protein AB0H34_36175 [Saccharopolyspora shandongensis]|uniref:hypothetical protein n=1 Tax=Saccharopolyspora shandongensis TaxID=418495 RepID=UPI0033D94591
MSREHLLHGLAQVLPDLYAAECASKVRSFLTQLFADANAGKPLMHEYYTNYFDLYWDLHLGATGEAIPAEVRQIGAGFTAVLGYWYPTLDIVRENIMRVRELRPSLLLRTVWTGGIEFIALDVDQPEELPVAPRTVIDDNIGFRRAKSVES